MSRLRVDLRLVAAAGLALIAGLSVLSITRPPERIEVLVAADTLPAGVAIEPSMFRTQVVEPIGGLVRTDEAPGFSGWTLAVTLPAGAALTESVLTPPAGSTPDLMALTLEMGHAVQGRFLPGDLVDIYVTDDLGTTLLAGSVMVVSAELGTGGLGSEEVALLLAVDDALAVRLVAAMHTTAIDLVLVAE